jgi:hypothetical protein
MNSIRSATAVVAVLAAGAGTVAAVTSVDSASAGTATASARSFTVHAHHGSDTPLDLGQNGFSAGDQDLFTGALTRSGTHVGRLVGSCTTARVGRSSADQLCEFVLRLRKGQITASGSVGSTSQGPGTFSLPILGGTGRYQGAAGQIAVTSSNAKSIPITVSLR